MKQNPPFFYTLFLSLFCLTSLLTLSSCEKVLNDTLEEIKANAQPLPEDKMAYAGYWEGTKGNKTLRLWIKKNGDFYAQSSKPYGKNEHNSEHGFATTSNIHSPIVSIDDKTLVVGIMKLTTTYQINKPPYTHNDQWHMTIDGIPLTKKPEAILPDAFD